MRFGVVLAPRIDDWEVFRYAEELGFDSAWCRMSCSEQL